MTWHYTVAWLLYFALVTVGFFAIEMTAVRRQEWDGTLTHHLRRWFSFNRKAGWHWHLRRMTWLAVALLPGPILTAHLLSWV